MMKRTLALPLTALALIAPACSSDGGSRATGGDPTQTTVLPGDSVPATGPVDRGGSGSSGPVGFAPASLQRFGDCAAFLDYVHTEGAERVGPYGFEQGGFEPEVMVADDMAVEMEEAGEVADAPASTDSASARPATAAGDDTDAQASVGGGGEFSTTNVQVEGVDEPDIVKTDGERIIAIAGETLHYIDVSADGTSGTLRGSVELNNLAAPDEARSNIGRYTYGHEIFLAGDRVFVFAQGEGGFSGIDGPFPVDDAVDVITIEPAEEPPAEEAEDPAADPDDERISTDTIDTPDDADAEAGFAPAAPQPVDPEQPLPVEPGMFPMGYLGPQTVVLEIDVSNPDAPSIANTMTIDGRYISARTIGDTARLVVTSPPQDLGFLYPSNPGTEDKAEEANRQVVLDSTTADWIPDYTLIGADGSVQTGEITDCSGVHAPSDFSGFDMLSVVTLDLGEDLGGSVAGDPGTLGGTTVLASGETVYASQDRLYVSTNIWEPTIRDQSQDWLEENYQTALHRFSISGDGPAAYEGSGSITGHLLNQFSMNDRDGVLYAATTIGAPWGGTDSVSQIVALEMDGDRLEQIGSVGGLGETERIFSVRYVDDTAYVVTFRQTDPFYVVDIGDPRNMTVQGELKIPGFSSYLHPISDDLVLGVGQDATDEGRTTGTKVSLFDVSNPADPLEVDVWTLPNAYSDAEFDHRAFLWWAPTNTAVLPLQSWNDQFAGAVVLKVENGTITEQGRISQAEEDSGVTGQTDCRVLTAADLDDQNGEAEWIFSGGNQVNLCTANQSGGASGMYCEVIPVGDIELGVEFGIDIDMSQYDRVEFCYRDWDGYRTAVQRILVIDGNLWTLSPERLQSNDLTTLDRNIAIDLA